MTALRTPAVLALALCGTVHAAIVDPPPSEVGRPQAGPRASEPADLEALARATFERLRPLFPSSGPIAQLKLAPDRRPDAFADATRTITVTRGMLLLCARPRPRAHELPDEGVRTRIAFVLAHELAHLSHGHAGLFERGAKEAMETAADRDAAGALLAAGFNVDHLQLGSLLDEITRATRIPNPGARKRVGQVRAAVATADRHAHEWQLGWLLSVAGQFDRAQDLYRSFAARYPLPSAMYAFAHTRMLASWRRYPCTDRELLEWYPPIRYDPRSQIRPFALRSADDNCASLRKDLADADAEFEAAAKIEGGYPPAQIALASLRLILGSPTLHLTARLGGVTQVGGACGDLPTPDGLEALSLGDACQVSLLSQFEIGARSPEALRAAIDGLLRLQRRWPSEPSLQYNLARLLSYAGRQSEADEYWTEFLRSEGQGPYGDQARSVLRSGGRPGDHAPSSEGETPRSDLGPRSDTRLDAVAAACTSKRQGAWRQVTLSSGSSLSYCGDWNDELVIRSSATGAFVRTLDASSAHWPEAQAPATPPVFVSNEVTGDVLRLWEREAWLFRHGEPRRVVYFRPPQ
jgi:tetratricopeptide (TPR) repeat protein